MARGDLLRRSIEGGRVLEGIHKASLDFALFYISYNICLRYIYGYHNIYWFNIYLS